MIAYYSEFDPKAAAWLRELMKADLIPAGDVDERSITDVTAGDLVGYPTCHWFAGIGGWPYALRLAGWPDDRPVWTGSCPCQPFSAAGKRKGEADSRHLWPAFFRLIRECRPGCVIGEQVEGAVRLGWLDGVFADLEGEGYACGAAVLGAHSVGAPHIRQRLFWVADAGGRDVRVGGHDLGAASGGVQGQSREQRVRPDAGDGCDARRLADARRFQHTGSDARRDGIDGESRPVEVLRPGPEDADDQRRSTVGGVADAASRDDEHDPGSLPCSKGSAAGRGDHGLGSGSSACRVGHAHGEREDSVGGVSEGAGVVRAGSPWDAYALTPCRDGKARRTQPGLFPLADGIPDFLVPVWAEGNAGLAVPEAFPGRVGLLRGAGNAIVPQVAAAFIRAYMECRS